MNILYFTQFYTPEAIAGAFRAHENAINWSTNNNVTIFTGFPNYPTGQIFKGYNPKLISKDIENGITVIRNKLIAKPNSSIIKRLENVLSYYCYGLFNITFNKRVIGKDYDIVLGTSGPIFNAMLAFKFAKKNRIPFVFEIRDITYIQMQATGKSASSMGVKIMKYLELSLCQKADKVVVVTNGFKKLLVDEGIPKEKIQVVTNGVDVLESKGVYNDGNDFVLSYFGTLGISQNIRDTFSYAEVISKNVKNFKYLIIGEGAQKNDLQAEASEIPYIEMLPGLPVHELEPYYNKTQLSIITLRKTDNFKYTIPSKLFQVMGRGIAVLFIGPDGETAEIIRNNNAGITLTGTQSEDFESLGAFFMNNEWKDNLKEMGSNGRKTVEENYSRSVLSSVYLELLDSVRKGK